MYRVESTVKGMNSSRPSTFIILAYSICVLLLPWTTYSSISGPVAGSAEQSIASAYDAMAQPLLWQQQDLTLKGKNKSPDNVPQTKNDFDVADDDASSSPNVRSPLAHSLLPAAPHLHIKLPSWRGLIPYSLPPPSLLSA